MSGQGPTVSTAVPAAPAFAERGLWITWERQRRSLELAKALGVPLLTWTYPGPYVVKVVALSLKTALSLAWKRPDVLFVQNPSMVLAAVACALRPLLRYRLIVDRHSNFRLHERSNPALKWRLFHRLSRYTVRKADLTIVTNEALASTVSDWGGRAFTLPDKIPTLPFAVPAPLPGRQNVVFICSHGEDEPIREVLQAAALLPDVDVYVTGNSTATRMKYQSVIPANVQWTGYLPEAEYQALLASCDAVLALTTAANTLLCGAYEAVALAKPLVLSKQKALADYFVRGRILTDHTAEDLAAAIRQALAEDGRLQLEMRSLLAELTESWSGRWTHLLATIESLLVPAGQRGHRGSEVAESGRPTRRSPDSGVRERP